MDDSDSERVVIVSKYNYHKYYNQNKERYEMNRQLREKKNKLEEDSKEHYKKFWDSFLIRTPINLVNQEMK
jgi:hypothetical protein